MRELIKEAKQIAYSKGFKFLRWNVGFTKVGGKEHRYPVMEFTKERGGLVFIDPCIHKAIPCNPLKRIMWDAF